MRTLLSFLVLYFPCLCVTWEGIPVLLCFCLFLPSWLPQKTNISKAGISNMKSSKEILRKHREAVREDASVLCMLYGSSPVDLFCPPAVSLSLHFPWVHILHHPVVSHYAVTWCTAFGLFLSSFFWIIASNFSHCVDSLYSTALQTTAVRQPRGTEMSPGWEQGKRELWLPEKCKANWPDLCN